MTVHVIGAGLAGLAASVRLVSAGRRVALYEAAPQAGGRCRSYRDPTLGRVIDNGNHLMLSGNDSLFGYLQKIGTTDSLIGPDRAEYPFVDLKSGERWTIKIGNGRWSRWFNNPLSQVPGAGLICRLKSARLALASEDETVAGCLRHTGALWTRFWEPMATAILNTPLNKASAQLLGTTLQQSLARGGRMSRPLIARDSLAASLIDPALELLARERTDLFFGQRLRGMDLGSETETLHFTGFDVTLDPRDQVILALPPAQTGELLPDLLVPTGAHPIVNAHFRLPKPLSKRGRSMLLGLVGGHAHWLFIRDDLVSVTVSAAETLADEPADAIAFLLWTDVAAALDQPTDPIPPFRVIKEKRATFSQTPSQLLKRPTSLTSYSNLYLAGDWTDTGLPATIEGAILSGDRAADAVMSRRLGRAVR